MGAQAAFAPYSHRYLPARVAWCLSHGCFHEEGGDEGGDEEVRNEGCRDEEGEEGGQRDEESSHEEGHEKGHEEGEGDRGCMRCVHEGGPRHVERLCFQHFGLPWRMTRRVWPKFDFDLGLQPLSPG